MTQPPPFPPPATFFTAASGPNSTTAVPGRLRTRHEAGRFRRSPQWGSVWGQRKPMPSDAAGERARSGARASAGRTQVSRPARRHVSPGPACSPSRLLASGRSQGSRGGPAGNAQRERSRLGRTSAPALQYWERECRAELPRRGFTREPSLLLTASESRSQLGAGRLT